MTEKEIVVDEVQVAPEKPKAKPKQKKTEPKIPEPKTPEVQEKMVHVMFRKRVAANNRFMKIHETAWVKESELKKLPENSYLIKD